MSSRRPHSRHPPSDTAAPPTSLRASTPPPTAHHLTPPRVRRSAGGGFLLDTSTRSRTSLDAPPVPASISSSPSTAVLTSASHASSEDADAELSELVELVLTEASRRKRISSSSTSGAAGTATTSRRTVSPTAKRKSSGSGGGGTRPRNVSPTHSFLLSRQLGQPAQGQHLDVPKEFSEATSQRAQRAREALELKYLALRLGAGENPLKVIRDRKLRVKIDVSRFEDLNAVKSWADAVERATEESNAGGDASVPAPPPGKGRRFKKPRVDWIVTPEEVLADWWWAKEGARAREGEARAKEDGERVKERAKEGERRRSVAGKGARSRSREVEEESSTTESEDEDEYENGDSEDESGSEKGEGSGYHRKRRKLGRMIKPRRNRRKRKQVGEEKKKRQSIDVSALSELDRQLPPRATADINEHAHQYPDSTNQHEDGYDSEITNGRASPTKLSSAPSLPGNELFVPSIAINLDPPGAKHDPEDRDSDRLSPKKLALLKDKDIDDRRRGSWDGDRSRISLDRERGTVSRKVERAKTRVDKLRSGVVKVEEYMPWRRGTDSTGPSPTASSFTDSDVEDRPLAPRKRTSAPELDERRPTRHSLDVPRPEFRRGHSALGGLSGIALNPRASSSPERKRRQARERSLTRDAQLGAMEAEQSEAAQPQTGELSVAASPSLALSRSRDAHRARTSLLAAAILARRFSARLPPPPPRLPSSTLKTSQALHALSTHHSELTTSTLPALSEQLDQITTTLSGEYLPTLHALADESEMLESLASGEMTMTANQTRRDIQTVLRRKRRRGWVGWMVRIGWGLAGWVVVAVMWVVWAVVVALRMVRWMVGGVVRVARWVLWI